jgi:hypothetical protein
MLTLNNTPLEKVSTYPQLGTHFDEIMSWEAHITQIILSQQEDWFNLEN